jgi:hypothetical protein
MSYLFRIYGSGTHRILVKTSTIVEISTFTFIGDTKAPGQRNKSGDGYFVLSISGL